MIRGLGKPADSGHLKIGTKGALKNAQSSFATTTNRLTSFLR